MPTSPPRPGISGAIFDATQRWTKLAVGIAALSSDFSDASYDTAAGRPAKKATAKGRKPAGSKRPLAPPRAGLEGSVALLPGALLGLTLTAQDRVFDAISGLEARLQTLVARALDLPVVSAAHPRLDAALERWNAEYQDQRAQNATLAAEYLAHAGPKTLDQLLARIDIEMVLERVDIDEIIDKVDLDAVIDRVAVERVIDKIDLRTLVLDTVAQVQVTDILREGTGAMTASTAAALRERVNTATRLAGRPLRR